MMFLLNEENYVSLLAMTYAVSEQDESKIRSIFEELIEKKSSLEIKCLFQDKKTNNLLTIEEHKRYYYFANAVLMAKKQDDSSNYYEVKIEKLFRALFPDIFSLVKRNKSFHINDYLFLFNEAEGLTAQRKLLFSNRIVALMFFVLNKWGEVDLEAYKFGESLFDISIEDKKNTTMPLKINSPTSDERNRARSAVKSFFKNEQFELGFDYLYGLHGIGFDKIYYYYGEKNDVIDNTILTKDLLCRQFQSDGQVIDFLSYNVSMLFALIKDYLVVVKDADIYFGKYYISALRRDIKELERNKLSNRKKNEQVVKQKNEIIERLINEEAIKDKKITALFTEITKLKEQLSETVALRNFVYNQRSEEEYADDELVIWNIIDELRGVIVGGNDSWQKRMREKLPSWSYISASMNNIDRAIVENTDHVFVNTSFLGHSKYYGIVSIVQSTGCFLGYINSHNPNRVYAEMVQQLKQLDEKFKKLTE